MQQQPEYNVGQEFPQQPQQQPQQPVQQPVYVTGNDSSAFSAPPADQQYQQQAKPVNEFYQVPPNNGQPTILPVPQPGVIVPPQFKRQPLVSTCCGCNNLRSGAFILAIVFLVFDGLGIISAIIQLGRGAVIAGAVGIVIDLLFAGFDAMGCYGVYQNNVTFVRVWVYFTMVRIGLSSLVAILLVIYAGIVSFLIYLLVIGLYIYWLVCIYSYYMDLRDRPEAYTGEGAAAVATTTVQPVYAAQPVYVQPVNFSYPPGTAVVAAAPGPALAPPPPATYAIPVTDDGPMYVPPGQQQQQQQAQIPVVDNGPVYVPPGQQQA